MLTGRSLDPCRTDIPARLDRLPWSRFHWLVVVALGASWAIDGLEVTLKGAVSGALLCGHLTDRHGRARLFFITMAIYLTGTLLTAGSWDFLSLCVFRA